LCFGSFDDAVEILGINGTRFSGLKTFDKADR